MLPTSSILSLSCFPKPNPPSRLSLHFHIPNQRASPCTAATFTSLSYPLLPPRRSTALSHSSSLVGKWRCNAGDESEPGPQRQGSGLDWPILERWDVPWEWPTLSLTFLACGLRSDGFRVSFVDPVYRDKSSRCFVLTGLVGTAALPYLGLRIEELRLDEKAEILLIDQGITTAAVLAVLYGITGTFKPLPEDLFRYDLRQPFDLQRGWLLWAGVGLGGAVLAIALVGVAMSIFRGDNPERETDSLVRLLPLIGSSGASTACLVAITGVLAPLLEETVFRGFLMVSLTKWVPTPVAVLISAAVFAFAHLTPGEFPQLFVLGTALGLIYAQTRNLLAPITVHALWNSGVILLLTFLQLQGYDIRELLQAT